MALQDGPASREIEPVPGIAAAGKRTVESVGATDALMDALELAAHEAERLQVRLPMPTDYQSNDQAAVTSRWQRLFAAGFLAKGSHMAMGLVWCQLRW